MSTNTQRQQRSVRRTVTSIAAAAGIALASTVGLAAPASAASIVYQYTHPSPSGWCMLTGICRTVTHCYPTNPYKTWSPEGCYYPHNHRI